MDKKTIVVVGAGQGLGNHVAKRFGKEGFRVVLMRGKSVTNIPNCKEATFPRRTMAVDTISGKCSMHIHLRHQIDDQNTCNDQNHSYDGKCQKDKIFHYLFNFNIRQS